MHKLPLTQVSNYQPVSRLNRQKQFWGILLRGAAVFVAAAATVVAQDAATPEPDTDNGLRGLPVTLAGQFFDHDFVNYTLFGNVVFDTNLATLQGAQTVNGSGFGWSAGGGVTASHLTRNTSFSLNYRGDYRRYGTSGYGSGTDQNLALDYSVRLSRRWSTSITAGGGILLYGGGFYSVTPNSATSVATNPLSPETRFLSTGINFTYQQTRRLSYVFGGQFFLNDYNYAGGLNSRGASGLFSVVYRLTGKTSLAGTYSHSYYTYSPGAGSSTLDGGSLTLSHNFAGQWQGSVTAGINRTHSSGTITLPVAIILGQQTVNGYVTGPYDNVSLVPSFQGSLTPYRRHSAFSVSGGQGVNPGNGVFLTSRSQFLSSTYSYSTRRSNFSLGASYNRLSSIANSISQTYSSGNLSASYSYVVRRHLSADFRYDLISYGGLLSLGGVTEHRLSAGLSLSSKSIPLTLF
jgi:hypothetical protein